MLNKTQAIVDRALRVTLFDLATGEVVVAMPEFEDFQVSVQIENEKTATSASGATVATMEEGKSAEITGNASFFNYALMAAQSGTDAEQATADATIKAPKCDIITIAGGKATLSQEAVGTAGAEIGAIYEILPDGGAGKKYDQGLAASETDFVYSNKEITAPTGIADGTRFYVFYEYNSPTAVHIVEDGDKFAGTYRLWAEIVTKDLCDKSKTTVMTWVAPNAKLSTARDISMTTDGKHPVTLRCETDYCAGTGTKRLFDIFAPEE